MDRVYLEDKLVPVLYSKYAFPACLGETVKKMCTVNRHDSILTAKSLENISKVHAENEIIEMALGITRIYET